MRACSGVWVAHGSGSRRPRDRRRARTASRVPPGRGVVPAAPRLAHPRGGEGLLLRLLQRGAVAALPHRPRAPDLPQRGLGALPGGQPASSPTRCAQEVDSDDPIVLVQDYHFALAPRLIRERLPRATIITFWHIPWPNAERFGICPWREELLEGMLGAASSASTPSSHCNNFLDSVDRFLESAHRSRAATRWCSTGAARWCGPTRSRSSGRCAGSRTSPPVARVPRRRAARELGLPPDALLGVGVDRLDYTKGIEERLLAVERLLERYPRVPRPLHLRAARRAEPHRDRALPRAQRARRARSPTRINERFGRRHLPADRPAAQRTTSRRRSSATTAPPTSAT